MLFNSFEFLIFLPIVFLLYWFVFQAAALAKPIYSGGKLHLLRLVGLAFPHSDCVYHALQFCQRHSFGETGRAANQTKMGQRSEYHPQPANSLHLQVLQLLRREPDRTVPTLRRRSGLGDDRYIAAGGHQLLHLPSAQLYHRCVPT